MVSAAFCGGLGQIVPIPSKEARARGKQVAGRGLRAQGVLRRPSFRPPHLSTAAAWRPGSFGAADNCSNQGKVDGLWVNSIEVVPKPNLAKLRSISSQMWTCPGQFWAKPGQTCGEVCARRALLLLSMHTTWNSVSWSRRLQMRTVGRHNTNKKNAWVDTCGATCMALTLLPMAQPSLRAVPFVAPRNGRPKTARPSISFSSTTRHKWLNHAPHVGDSVLRIKGRGESRRAATLKLHTPPRQNIRRGNTDDERSLLGVPAMWSSVVDSYIVKGKHGKEGEDVVIGN